MCCIKINNICEHSIFIFNNLIRQIIKCYFLSITMDDVIFYKLYSWTKALILLSRYKS